MRIYIGISCAASLLFACLAGCSSDRDDFPKASPVAMYLTDSWQAYKETFITDQGYVWDRSRDGGEVTSEGQSYALLRSVWMRDQKTFDLVLEWTERILARPDGLFSWRWHPDSGIVDANSATDADVDIAFALLMAAKAFNAPAYESKAAALVKAVRLHTSIALPGGWFPSAGNWAVMDRVVNISYFAPYAYAAFARLDPAGDWPAARKAGYDILARMTEQSPYGLVPDFAVVGSDGAISSMPTESGLSNDFSFDAMRIYWRVAVDCLLTSNPRACADPTRTGKATELFARDGAIFSRYSLEGTKKSDVVSVSFYGSLLPALGLNHPALATALLQKELSPLQLMAISRDPDRYYDLNWCWFGLAAQSGLLIERTPALFAEE